MLLWTVRVKVMQVYCICESGYSMGIRTRRVLWVLSRFFSFECLGLFFLFRSEEYYDVTL